MIMPLFLASLIFDQKDAGETLSVTVGQSGFRRRCTFRRRRPMCPTGGKPGNNFKIIPAGVKWMIPSK